jgi:hypothetical protein
MENGITFVLPTLDSSSMSRADQAALVQEALKSF